VSLPAFTYGPFSVSDATAKINVKPHAQGTVTTFAIQASDLKVQQTSLGPVKMSLSLEPRGISVKVDSSDPRFGSLHWDGFIDTNGAAAGGYVFTGQAILLDMNPDFNQINFNNATIKAGGVTLQNFASFINFGNFTIKDSVNGVAVTEAQYAAVSDDIIYNYCHQTDHRFA
jgi:hypothetical protein